MSLAANRSRVGSSRRGPRARRPASRAIEREFASTRASTAARRCSSRRRISSCANVSNATSASAGPRQSPSAARSSRRPLGVAALERGGAFAHQADEDLRIELPRADRESISARDGSQRLRPEWLEHLLKLTSPRPGAASSSPRRHSPRRPRAGLRWSPARWRATTETRAGRVDGCPAVRRRSRRSGPRAVRGCGT